MKRVLALAIVAGLGVMVGCEEKKTDSLMDSAKKSADSVAAKAKDAAATATDKAKDMGNVVTDKLKGEVQNLMDTVKGKVDQLVKGGETLKADQKPEFDKAVSGIKSTWEDLSKNFSSLSSQSGDGLMKTLGDLKTKGTELMTTVKNTAEKFGIKLN